MRRRSSGSAAEDDGDDQAPSSADATSSLEGTGGKLSRKSDQIAIPTKTSSLEAKSHIIEDLDRRKSTDKRPVTRSRRPSNTNWKPGGHRDGSVESEKAALESTVITVPAAEAEGEGVVADKMPDSRSNPRRSRFRNPWSTSLFTFITTALAIISLIIITHSFVTRQLDQKGALMSYTSPGYAKLVDFDTEHSRFASKYSVYLYRETGVDEDTKVFKLTVTHCIFLTHFLG